MTPKGAFANSLVALEALSGLMGFLFARFSRPSAHRRFGRSLQGHHRLHVPHRQRPPKPTLGPRSRQPPFPPTPPRTRQRRTPAHPWVIVHPIDANSPFFARNLNEILAADSDIVYGATPNGVVTIDLSKISAHAPAPLPAAPNSPHTSPSVSPSAAAAAPH